MYSLNKTLELANKIGYSNCLKVLNDFIVKEGCTDAMPLFDENSKVIDMDLVEMNEANNKGRKQNKSMDSVFVISLNDYSVFVEFRFNYINIRNIKPEDLVLKKQFSSQLLIDKGVSSIYGNFYYVFSTNMVEQGKRRLRNLHPTVPRNFIACSIHDIKRQFFT